MSSQSDDYTIYALMFNPTKKLYIGSSTNVRERYKGHIDHLRMGKHQSRELQEDYNKYGEDFSIYILEEVANGRSRVEWGIKKISLVRAKEYDWMKKYDTINSGYNLQDWQALKSIELASGFEFPLKEGLPPLPTERIT